jgi:LVIVD repeat
VKARLRRIVPAFAIFSLISTSAAEGVTADWELTPAGWRSGPIIDHVTNVPFDGAIGAVVHGNFLYVSSEAEFAIFDISTPAAPQLLSREPLGPHALNEHPDTNGRILILSRDALPATRSLEVWDVTDKTNPQRLGGFANTHTDHTWACVLDCTFAYGSHGTIVSLANPSAPVKVGDWRTAVTPAPTRFHGIDQVAPGFLLTASEPTVFLDARNPTSPVAVATANPPVSVAGAVMRRSIPSYAHWPRAARDRFALESIETPFSGPCTEGSGGLVTYDTTGFETTGTFAIADVFRITQNGTYTDGYPPTNTVGCSAFGLAESPTWSIDRLVAVAWLEHGIRLLRVAQDGSISEAGGFMGHGTQAAYPVWAPVRRTSRAQPHSVLLNILYVADTSRGLDVYRVRPGAA